MTRQRGFVLGITAYAAIAAFVAISGLSVWGWFQTQRLASCKQEFVAFQERVKAEGEAAIAEAKRIEADNQAKKVRYDNQIKALRASNSRISSELRDARSRSRFVPEASATTGSSDAACFGRAELERTLQQLDDSVSGIVAEGDAARIGLDVAKQWAADVVK